MYQIRHPNERFDSISHGLKFKDGVASTSNKALANRLRKLGFVVVDDQPTPAKPEDPVKKGKTEA